MNMFLKNFGKYRSDKNILIEELRNIMKTNEEAILVDVRSPQEYNEGHINRSY